ncbi:MAG: hypothetical protein DRN17_07125, partial [Thermoplasmata archaeon]
EDVGTYFGTTSDIYKAAEIVFAQSVRTVKCVRAASDSEEHLQAALDELVDEGVNFIVYANELLSDTNSNAFNAIISKCNTNNWLFLIGASGIVSTCQTNFGALTDSNNVAGFCVKGFDGSNTDIAAALTGKYAQKKPWEKLMWTDFEAVTVRDFYSSSDVEDLEDGVDGSAPFLNAIIYKRQRSVASDGLTTKGGTYNYIDIPRTEYWLRALIENKIEAVLMSYEVPFSDEGIEQIRGAIAEACQEVQDGGGINSYDIDMPLYSEISDEDRASRTLKNVIVSVQLAGHIQRIDINLEINI